MKIRHTFRLRAARSFSKFISKAARNLPAFDGREIHVEFRPALTVSRRQLQSNTGSGQPVHAGTFIRKREIVFDHELINRPREFARILTHELFHFAWVRLGNPLRRSYAALLLDEQKRGVRGELGWSAEWRKESLAGSGGRLWNEYVCESFCDTAAWLHGSGARHPEFTLAARHRGRRAKWFQAAFQDRGIPI